MSESIAAWVNRIETQPLRTQLDRAYEIIMGIYNAQYAGGATDDEAYLLTAGWLQDKVDADEIPHGLANCMQAHLDEQTGHDYVELDTER